VNETLDKLKELGVDMETVLGQIAMAGAMVLEGNVKRDIASKKSGREYTRGNKTHVASAPGESPAVDTGALLNSIHSELGDVTSTRATAVCGTNMEYALPLEEGTAKMAARPFMRPGAERAKPDIENAMQAVARQAVDAHR
jgi:HK97 gp10 family phage protein